MNFQNTNIVIKKRVSILLIILYLLLISEISFHHHQINLITDHSSEILTQKSNLKGIHQLNCPIILQGQNSPYDESGFFRLEFSTKIVAQVNIESSVSLSFSFIAQNWKRGPPEIIS